MDVHGRKPPPPVPENNIHSSQYKKEGDYKGKIRIGYWFWNYACEIARDLFEQGAFPSMSVRSAVNVCQEIFLASPVLQLGLLMAVYATPRCGYNFKCSLIIFVNGDITNLA
jgi:hypothetical protein